MRDHGSPDSSESPPDPDLVEPTIQKPDPTQTKRRRRGPDRVKRRPLTPEHRAKLAAARRGRPMSQSDLEHLKSARQARWVHKATRAWSTFVLLWAWISLQLRESDRTEGPWDG